MSKSGLDIIHMQSPAHYIVQKRHPKPSKRHYDVGSAYHCAILEPEDFESRFVPDPFPGEYTKAGTIIGAQTKEAKLAKVELEEQGFVVLQTAPKGAGFWDRDDWNTVLKMRDSTLAHPVASFLLDKDAGRPELSVYWIDERTRKLCRCRPDFWNEEAEILVDLKSTDDASYTSFAKSVANYRYHVQHPFYLDGVRAAGRPAKAFIFIACEKSPPYGIGVYKLSPDDVHIGRTQYQHDLELYAYCHNNNEWPAYPPEISDLEMPAWGRRGHVS